MTYETDKKKETMKLDIHLDIPESWKKELALEKMLDRFDDAGEPFSGIFLFLVAILNNILSDMRDIKEMVKNLEKRL